MVNGADESGGSGLFRQRVREASRANGGSWWADPSRRTSPGWDRQSGGNFIADDETVLTAEPDEEPRPGEVPVAQHGRLGGAFFAALALLALLMVTAHVADIPRLSRVLVPVIGLLGTIGIVRWLQTRHPDEPWLGRLLILGVIVKIGGTVLRYT